MAVKKEVETAVELLLRLSPLASGVSELEAFRRTFVERYGNNREISLIEALDPFEGIGPYPPIDGSQTLSADPSYQQRQKLLLSLAETSLTEKRREVSLNDKLQSQLSLRASRFPSSVELAFQLLARSNEDIDRGAFHLIIAPNVGSPEAGRYLGRFVTLMEESDRESLRSLIQAEETIAREYSPEHCLFAELVFTPNRSLLRNVTTRSAFRSYEVCLTGAPSNGSEQIDPNDLLLGVEGDRFYLRSIRNNARVEIRSGHMLRTSEESSLVRFLHAVSADKISQLMRFDWGIAESFRYLPRVTSGKIVLRPAEWKLPTDLILSGKCRTESELAHTIHLWLEASSAPRFLSLTNADNFLDLDLQLAEHRQILLEEAKSLGSGDHLVLREVLPEPYDSWLKGDYGYYRAEFVVPLVQRRELNGEAHNAITRPSYIERRHRHSDLRKGPGNEWLFITLFGPEDLQDRLLRTEICTFFRSLSELDPNSYWFFVRYRDTRNHLRIRLKGRKKHLITRALPRMCKWAQVQMEKGLFSDFAFPTYEREVERYGGPEALAEIEKFFWIDSVVVCDFLKAEKAGKLSDILRVEFSAACMHVIFSAMHETIKSSHTDLSRVLGPAPGKFIADIRDRSDTWMSLIEQDLTAATIDQKRIFFIRQPLQVAALKLAKRLHHLHINRALYRPPNEIAFDICHMHCNRVLGLEREDEIKALALLWRTYGRMIHSK
jgi:thiopeptide-type bacteriocin biosynthesis protein